MQIGLSINKTFTIPGAPDFNATFWAIEEVKQNPILKKGYINLVPYADQATFLNDKTKYYPPGRVVFLVNPGNWPFVTGTDPVSHAWAFIKTFTQTEDADGNETNGGLDWSTAIDVTI